jgi:transposase-like protein
VGGDRSIAAKIGCTAETWRLWVRQAERDSGKREGQTSSERERIKALEREVRLKLTSASIP